MNELLQWAAIIALGIMFAKAKVGSTAAGVLGILALAGKALETLTTFIGGKKKP